MNNPWIIAVINGAIVIVAALVLFFIMQAGKYQGRRKELKKILKDAKHLIENRQFPEALGILESKKLHFIKKTGDQAMIQTYLGICHKNIAEQQNTPENLRLAVRHFEEAARIMASIKSIRGVADVYNELGSSYLTLANHDQKESNLIKAKNSFEKGLSVIDRFYRANTPH
jgi:tetratricopeptide (TPR) repeat protein